jgi:hypothetical protein
MLFLMMMMMRRRRRRRRMRRTIPMSFVMIDISGRIVKIHQPENTCNLGPF